MVSYRLQEFLKKDLKYLRTPLELEKNSLHMYKKKSQKTNLSLSIYNSSWPKCLVTKSDRSSRDLLPVYSEIFLPSL